MVGKVPSCVRPQVQRAGAAAVEMDQVKREVAAGVARVPVSMVRVEGAAPLLPRPSLQQKGPRRGARLDSWALSALGTAAETFTKRRTRGNNEVRVIPRARPECFAGGHRQPAGA